MMSLYSNCIPSSRLPQRLHQFRSHHHTHLCLPIPNSVRVIGRLYTCKLVRFSKAIVGDYYIYIKSYAHCVMCAVKRTGMPSLPRTPISPLSPSIPSVPESPYSQHTQYEHIHTCMYIHTTVVYTCMHYSTVVCSLVHIHKRTYKYKCYHFSFFSHIARWTSGANWTWGTLKIMRWGGGFQSDGP